MLIDNNLIFELLLLNATLSRHITELFQIKTDPTLKFDDSGYNNWLRWKNLNITFEIRQETTQYNVERHTVLLGFNLLMLHSLFLSSLSLKKSGFSLENGKLSTKGKKIPCKFKNDAKHALEKSCKLVLIYESQLSLDLKIPID